MRGERKIYVILFEILPTMTSLILASFLGAAPEAPGLRDRKAGALLARAPRTARRYRDGSLETVPLDEVVAGDLLLVAAGDDRHPRAVLRDEGEPSPGVARRARAELGVPQPRRPRTGGSGPGSYRRTARHTYR